MSSVSDTRYVECFSRSPVQNVGQEEEEEDGKLDWQERT